MKRRKPDLITVLAVAIALSVMATGFAQQSQERPRQYAESVLSR